MDNQTKNDSTAGGQPDVSLIRGGPFYRLQQSTRLIGSNEWNVGRRIIFAIAVGWAPLLLMKLLFDRGNLVPLLKDYGLNVRMFLAVPILLLGQPLMESRFRMIVGHIYQARLLDGADLASMDNMLAALVRLRDSVLPELIILVLIAIRTSAALKTQMVQTPWLAYRVGDVFHLTLAGWYAAIVSATILQFLLFLNLWKWLLWTIFAFKFSRLNLKLIPTHPDENGGLGFLGMTPLAFAPIAFAATLVIGATFRYQILHHTAHLLDFKLPGLALVTIVALVALGPLIFFMPRLAAVRRKGIMEYAILGQMQSTDFHEKWIVHRDAHETELIDAPEISTLCDYGQAYDRIENTKPFPVDRGALVGLALSVVIPALPTVLAEIPMAVVLKQLLGALR
ncbi:MAG: hypothetical protein WCC92_11850 [Candidatus Korobacteraceae bacterium]